MSINFSARPTSQRTSYYNPNQTKTSTGRKERTYIITYDSSSGDDFQKDNISNIEQYNLKQRNVKVIKGTRYKKTSEIAKDQLSHSQNRIERTIYSNYTPEKLDNNLSEGVFFKENYTPIDYSKIRIFANQNRNYAKFYFPFKELNSIEKELIKDAPINWLLGKPDEFYYRSRTPYPKFQYQYQPGVKVTKKYYYNKPERYYYVEENKNNYIRPGRFNNESQLDKAATLISSHWKGHRYRIELNDYLRKYYDYNKDKNMFRDVYYESNVPRNYMFSDKKKINYDEVSNDSFRKSYLFKNKQFGERNDFYKKNVPQRDNYRNINNSNEIIEKYRNIISSDSNEYRNTNYSNDNYENYRISNGNDYKYIYSNEKKKVRQIPKEYDNYRNINNSHEMIEKYRNIISEEPNLDSSDEKYENKININISSNDKIEDNNRKNKPSEKIDNLKRYNIKKEIVDNKRNISPNDNVQNIKPNEKVSNYKNIITKERVDNKGNVVKETTKKSIITNSKNKDIKSPNNDVYYEEETEEIIKTKKPIYNIEKKERKIKDNNKEIIETEDIEITVNQEEIKKTKIIQNDRAVNKNKIDNKKELATKKLANTLDKKVKEEENILIDNLNKNRKEKRIEDGFNKVSNYMRKSSNKEVFDKINESNKEDENEIKLKSTPIVLDKNIKFKSKPNVLKKIDIEEEIIPVISGSGNEMKEDEKVILKNDLNIARRQTLTNLIVKKQTLQHAFDDNDDYDYEKEFLEMENNAKIGKFFDKAKERLRYYFNVFRRKTENYVEDIEEEIIDETENDKKEGLNKLKNIMDNANKNKGMKALKDNQKNEKIKEKFK